MLLYTICMYGDSSQHHNRLGKYMINMIVNLAFGFSKYSQVSEGGDIQRALLKTEKVYFS
jgi:hypothetical protein